MRLRGWDGRIRIATLVDDGQALTPRDQPCVPHAHRRSSTPIATDDSAPADIAGILAILFATGWAANHFASVLAVLTGSGRMSAALAEGAFGIYALGLLPGLLGGGSLSDRVGRRPVVVSGAIVAAVGNLAMAFLHEAAGVYLGRLVVGVGVGLTVSAGTAWTADLRGKAGATLAGVSLTAGFALGPLASGLLAYRWPSAALSVPFVVTAALSLAALSVGRHRMQAVGRPASEGAAARRSPTTPATGVGIALSTAVPMALWVFSSATAAFVTLASRLAERADGPWVPGLAAVITLGCGVLVQFAARRFDWGPRCGVAGAVLAGVGFALAAETLTAPSWPSFTIASAVLGCAYGLCLREGLIDVEILSPPGRRGVTTGVFYGCTYLGFALPVSLVVLQRHVDAAVPLLVLAVLAVLTAAVRAVQIRTGRLVLRERA